MTALPAELREVKVNAMVSGGTGNRHAGTKTAQVEHVDDTFGDNSYYYVRVTQAGKDEHGNSSRAWSSPIWVRRENRDG